MVRGGGGGRKTKREAESVRDNQSSLPFPTAHLLLSEDRSNNADDDDKCSNDTYDGTHD